MRPTSIRRMQRLAVSLLLLIGIINFIDRSALSIANPLIRHDLHLSIADMGWLLSAFRWAYAFSQLPGGLIVDRAGPRWLLGCGLILWSIAQMLGGFVTGLGQFIATRVLLGIGEAPTFTSAVRVIREWHSIKDRSLPVSICCSGPSSIGPLLAPPILTLLMLEFGWRWMFILLGIAGVIVSVIWMLKYRDIRDVPLTPDERQYLAIDDSKSVTAAKVTLADWRSLFRFRTTWGLAIGYAGNIYIGWLYLSWLPGYLEIQRHMSLEKTGIVAAIPFAFGLTGTVGGGWLANRLISRGTTPIVVCRSIVSAGLILAAACTVLAAEASGNVVAVGAICGTLFFGSAATGAAWALVGVAAPARYTASLGSILNFGGYFGGALAPVITGEVVQVTGSFVPALLLGAAVAAVAAAVYQFLIPRQPITLAGRPAIDPQLEIASA